ncbi:MAG TPA: ATP-binding protein [Usitatibacter sp.]|nr:ATP-binding protein [Usitatibacter sp.]
MVLVSALAFAGLAPFAKRPLPHVPAFISTYQAALVANDVITAALLFGQFGYFRQRSLLALASGYLFTALIAVAHALSFPGLFASSGLLGAGPQTTAWLYMFWHAGFPLFVIAYAVGDRFPLAGAQDGASIVPPVFACVAGVSAAVLLLVLLATAGAGRLPAIMSGNGYSASMLATVATVWLSSIAGLFFLWRRRPHSVLDLWLMVILWAWIFDIALSAVLNAGRFDLGFYAGRVYGLIAASFVLGVLLVENARLYTGLGERSRELERAREAALEAEKAKGAFLATMSHEIRTPMFGVMGMLELLSLTRLDREQFSTLQVVRESGRSLLRIIDDILDFSKVTAGKLELRAEPASIGDLVERVSNMYSGTASSKGLALRREVDLRIAPALTFDAVRVQQIVNNLVSNAIKFTQHGEVAVAADLLDGSERTQTVRITVRDTGVGIAAEDARKLFTPFSQASGSAPGGTGLGLSISRRLADLMGGRLEMESHPGVGTKMSLTLRLEVAPGPAKRDASLLAPASETLRRVRSPLGVPTIDEARRFGNLVVIVDDHPINRMLLAKQVATLGYAAETADSGEAALRLNEAGGVGLVITDCNMPGLDGYELARRIRASEGRDGRPRLPIVACTANALADEAAKCFAAGMDDYLAKPVTLEQLREKVERWVARPQAARGEEPVLEAEALSQVSSGDPVVEREILREFRRHHIAEEAAFRAAVASRDLEEVQRAAHRIRGASSSIGANRLAAACGRIESATRGNEWAAILAAARDFEGESECLLSHIERVESVP